MVSGQAVLIALAVALVIYAGEGIRHVGHNIRCRVHHTESCEPKK